MSKPNIVQDKSYAFSLKVIELCRFLMDQKKEYILSKQLCRSGTSIGANVEEAVHAPTKKDFIYKMSISLKEANETRYWIRLIIDSCYDAHKQNEFRDLLSDSNELIALLTSIIKSSRISTP
jgi:four helix bundle protein